MQLPGPGAECRRPICRDRRCSKEIYVPPLKPDEDERTRNIVLIASNYGRYGYRRVTAMLTLDAFNRAVREIKAVRGQELTLFDMKGAEVRYQTLGSSQCVLGLYANTESKDVNSEDQAKAYSPLCLFSIVVSLLQTSRNPMTLFAIVRSFWSTDKIGRFSWRYSA